MPFKDTFYWDLIKSIALPVLLFSSGYFLNVLVEKYKEKKRLKSIEQYFKTLLDLEYQVAMEQADIYEQSANRLTNLDEINVSTRKIIGHPAKSLSEIHHSDLYKIFIKGKDIDKRTRYFNRLLSTLNYIDSNINLVTIHSEGFELAVNKINKEWNETGKLLTSNLSKIANTRDLDRALKSKDPYIRTIGEVINFTKTTPKNEQTFSTTYKNVVERLLRFVNDPINIDDPRNQEFINLLVSLNQFYIQRQDLYSRRSNSCFESAKNLKISANEIKNIIAKL